MFHSSILNSRKIFKSVFALITFLALICANFISCDNFMNSGDIKKEIEDVIAFNNARVVNISLACDEAVGTLFPNQTYQARVGYAFEVQFIPNTSDYKIKDYSKIFKADSFRNNADRSDNVKIEVVEQSFEDKKSGVYRANITVTQYADDIRIRPECVAVPKISKITPENKKNGEDQDTPIIITFNKPMDAASFGDYSCISISSSEGNAWDYYDAPEFSDDKTQLTIQPKAGVLLLPPDEAKTADEITVEIDAEDIKDCDGLSLGQTAPYSFKINGNYGNKETVELTVQADAQMGTITPNGKVSCSLGYTTTVKFELNKNDYVFTNSNEILKAASSVQDCVSFTTLSTTQTEQTTIYEVKVRVLKNASDIIISPDCVKIPEILSISPQNISTGCDQDTPIAITFNKPVDVSTFDESSLSISNDTASLKQYFSTPYFSAGNTVLNIPVTQNSFILSPEGSRIQMDIFVKLDTTNLKDCDGLSIPQMGTYKYTINKNFGNQKKITVLIRTVEGAGTFLVDGERECIVGYSLGELQFTANKKTCVFTGLEAVSKTDTSISRNDSVEFTPVVSNEEDGIYTIRVRITDDVNDILIRPKVVLRPAVVRVTPEYVDEGKEPTEPIRIQFNRSFENVTTVNGDVPFDFKNVTIKCNGSNISSCFNEPVLSEDKTALIISPDVYKFSQYMTSKSITLADITVTLVDSRMYFLIDNQTVQIANDNSLTYKVRYNLNFETTPPTISSINAYRNYSNGSFSDAFNMSLTYGDSDDDGDNDIKTWSKDNVNMNRTKGSVYIKGRAHDSGSGVKSIKVQDNHIDTEYFSGNETSAVVYYENDENVLKWEKDGNYVDFVIQHEIELDDGLIELNISVRDEFENASTRNLVLIKINSSCEFKPDIYNVYFNDDDYYVHFYDVYSGSESPFDFDMQGYLNNIKTIKLIYVPDPDDFNYDYYKLVDVYNYLYFAGFYPGITVDPDDIYESIICRYYDDDGTLHETDMMDDENKIEYEDELEGAKSWNCTFKNVDNFNGFTFEIIISDNLGNSDTYTYQYPSKFTITDIESTPASDIRSWHYITSEQYKRVYFTPIDKHTSSYGLVIFTNDNVHWKAFHSAYGITDIIPGYTYQIIPHNAGDPTGVLSEPFTFDYEVSELPEIELDGEVTLESKPFNPDIDSQAQTFVKVPIKADTWTDYDMVLVYYLYKFKGDERTVGPWYYNNNEILLKPEVLTARFFDTTDHRISLRGITADGNVSQEKTYTITMPANLNSIDNQPPTVGLSRSDTYMEKVELRAIDYESRIDTVTLYVNNEKRDEFKDTSSYTDMNRELDVYDLLGDFTQDAAFLEVKLVAKDRAGLETTKNVEITINKTAPVYVYDKNNTYWTFYTEDTVKDMFINIFNGTTNQWDKGYRIVSESAASVWQNITVGHPNTVTTLKIPLNNTFQDRNLNPWADRTVNLNNKFIRIKNSDSIYQYYYVGLNGTDFKNSGRYDSLKKDSTSTDSFIVSSDAPVFVHTLVTNIPYETCRYWDVGDWEFYKKEVGPELFNFVARNQKQYYVPTNQIVAGQSYVVIAYFADGTSAMSDVMVQY